MSETQYQCDVSYCPFNDRYPERKHSPVSDLKFPMCNSRLVDDTQIQHFCEPYKDSFKSLEYEIQYTRLGWVAETARVIDEVKHGKRSGYSYSEQKMRLFEEDYLFGLIGGRIEDPGSFLHYAKTFARSLSCAWHMIKTREELVRNSLVNIGFRNDIKGWDVGDIEKKYRNDFEIAIRREQMRWLERIDNPNRLLDHSQGNSGYHYPYVTMGGIDNFDIVERLPGLVDRVLTCIPGYFEILCGKINEELNALNSCKP